MNPNEITPVPRAAKRKVKSKKMTRHRSNSDSNNNNNNSGGMTTSTSASTFMPRTNSTACNVAGQNNNANNNNNNYNYNNYHHQNPNNDDDDNDDDHHNSNSNASPHYPTNHTTNNNKNNSSFETTAPATTPSSVPLSESLTTTTTTEKKSKTNTSSKNNHNNHTSSSKNSITVKNTTSQGPVMNGIGVDNNGIPSTTETTISNSKINSSVVHKVGKQNKILFATENIGNKKDDVEEQKKGTTTTNSKTNQSTSSSSSSKVKTAVKKFEEQEQQSKQQEQKQKQKQKQTNNNSNATAAAASLSERKTNNNNNSGGGGLQGESPDVSDNDSFGNNPYQNFDPSIPQKQQHQEQQKQQQQERQQQNRMGAPSHSKLIIDGETQINGAFIANIGNNNAIDARTTNINNHNLEAVEQVALLKRGIISNTSFFFTNSVGGVSKFVSSTKNQQKNNNNNNSHSHHQKYKAIYSKRKIPVILKGFNGVDDEILCQEADLLRLLHTKIECVNLATCFGVTTFPSINPNSNNNNLFFPHELAGKSFVVLKHYPHNTLADFFALKRHEINDSIRFSLTFGLVSALAALHSMSQPVYHGNIQTGCCLVDGDGSKHNPYTIVLSDFRRSVQKQKKEDVFLCDLNERNTSKLNFRYVAPELIQEENKENNNIKKITDSSDIYSAACVVFSIWRTDRGAVSSAPSILKKKTSSPPGKIKNQQQQQNNNNSFLKECWDQYQENDNNNLDPKQNEVLKFVLEGRRPATVEEMINLFGIPPIIAYVIQSAWNREPKKRLPDVGMNALKQFMVKIHGEKDLLALPQDQWPSWLQKEIDGSLSSSMSDGGTSTTGDFFNSGATAEGMMSSSSDGNSNNNSNNNMFNTSFNNNSNNNNQRSLSSSNLSNPNQHKQHQQQQQQSPKLIITDKKFLFLNEIGISNKTKKLFQEKGFFEDLIDFDGNARNMLAQYGVGFDQVIILETYFLRKRKWIPRFCERVDKICEYRSNMNNAEEGEGQTPDVSPVCLSSCDESSISISAAASSGSSSNSSSALNMTNLSAPKYLLKVLLQATSSSSSYSSSSSSKTNQNNNNKISLPRDETLHNIFQFFDSATILETEEFWSLKKVDLEAICFEDGNHLIDADVDTEEQQVEKQLLKKDIDCIVNGITQLEKEHWNRLSPHVYKIKTASKNSKNNSLRINQNWLNATFGRDPVGSARTKRFAAALLEIRTKSPDTFICWIRCISVFALNKNGFKLLFNRKSGGGGKNKNNNDEEGEDLVNAIAENGKKCVTNDDAAFFFLSTLYILLFVEEGTISDDNANDEDEQEKGELSDEESRSSVFANNEVLQEVLIKIQKISVSSSQTAKNWILCVSRVVKRISGDLEDCVLGENLSETLKRMRKDIDSKIKHKDKIIEDAKRELKFLEEKIG